MNENEKKIEIIETEFNKHIKQPIDFDNVGCLELDEEQFYELKKECERRAVNYCYGNRSENNRFFYYLDSKEVFMEEGIRKSCYDSFLTINLAVSVEIVGQDWMFKEKILNYLFGTGNKKTYGGYFVFDAFADKIYDKFWKMDELIKWDEINENGRRVSDVHVGSMVHNNWKLISEMFL